MYSYHCDGKNQCDIESAGDGGGDLETSPLSLAMFVLLAEQAGEGSILWYICILWYLYKDLEFTCLMELWAIFFVDLLCNGHCSHVD